VIHVEGDVNSLRDMEIIQTELRLKDIEWVEKALEALKKSGRSLGSNSLADKARKEEIVIHFPSFRSFVNSKSFRRQQYRRFSKPLLWMQKTSVKLTGITKRLVHDE
jgi:ribosome-binding ATPase YchF (GTP1/OBG family)